MSRQPQMNRPSVKMQTLISLDLKMPMPYTEYERMRKEHAQQKPYCRRLCEVERTRIQDETFTKNKDHDSSMDLVLRICRVTSRRAVRQSGERSNEPAVLCTFAFPCSVNRL